MQKITLDDIVKFLFSSCMNDNPTCREKYENSFGPGVYEAQIKKPLEEMKRVQRNQKYFDKKGQRNK